MVHSIYAIVNTLLFFLLCVILCTLCIYNLYRKIMTINQSHLKHSLREILSIRSTKPWSDMDEVYPGIFLGGAEAAKNAEELKRLGVTHVLNACYSSANAYTALGVNTNQQFYTDWGLNCAFLGIPALDFSGFDIAQYFEQTSEFMDTAIKSNGKVLVHCFMGVSRSATLVIAYLMTKQNLSAPDALRQVRNHRHVYPNDGFLDQLCDLEKKLRG